MYTVFFQIRRTQLKLWICAVFKEHFAFILYKKDTLVKSITIKFTFTVDNKLQIIDTFYI